MASLNSTENTEVTDRLYKRLFHNMPRGIGPGVPQEYVPWEDVEKWVDHAMVRRWIIRLDETVEHYTKCSLARYISCGEISTTLPELAPQHGIDSTCRRIFAILVLIDRLNDVRLLQCLQDEKLCDRQLPFSPGMESLTGKKEVGRFLQLLDQTGREEFYRHQWTVLVPRFFKIPGQQALVYRFHPQTVLPWSPSSGSNNMLGTTANVYPIQIHESHHNFRMGRDVPKYTRVALKAFMDCISEAEFDAEVRALQRFSTEEPKHAHIMQLLAAFKLRGRFYIICPLAESNLSEFLRKNDGYQLHCRQALMDWLLKQCVGLATALGQIHVYRTRRADGTFSTRYGAHGDLKPENILWYTDKLHARGPSAPELPDGTFKLGDFGQARWRSTPELLRSDRGSHLSAVYRGPEQYYPTRLARSQESDVWALGCIFLELLVWLVQGHYELLEFEEERKRDREDRDVWRYLEGDRLFGPQRRGRYFKYVFDETDPENVRVVPVIKPAVTKRIGELREEARCYAIIRFLDFIEGAMMLLDDSKRPNCRTIIKKVTQFADLALDPDA